MICVSMHARRANGERSSGKTAALCIGAQALKLRLLAHAYVSSSRQARARARERHGKVSTRVTWICLFVCSFVR